MAGTENEEIVVVCESVLSLVFGSVDIFRSEKADGHTSRITVPLSISLPTAKYVYTAEHKTKTNFANATISSLTVPGIW